MKYATRSLRKQQTQQACDINEFSSLLARSCVASSQVIRLQMWWWQIRLWVPTLPTFHPALHTRPLIQVMMQPAVSSFRKRTVSSHKLSRAIWASMLQPSALLSRLRSFVSKIIETELAAVDRAKRRSTRSEKRSLIGSKILLMRRKTRRAMKLLRTRSHQARRVDSRGTVSFKSLPCFCHVSNRLVALSLQHVYSDNTAQSARPEGRTAKAEQGCDAREHCAAAQ